MHTVPADRDRRRAFAALATVQLTFGLFPVFGKLAMAPGGFSPAAVGAWRMGFGAFVISAVAWAIHGRAFWAIRGDFLRLCVASVLGVSANMLLYLEGLERSSANEATLVMCLIPVFTFSIAAAAGQEALRPARGFGILVALAGASALFWAQDRAIAREHLAGNLLMALNAFSYAGYFVWTRPILRRHPPLVVIAWVFVLSLPATIWITVRHDLWPADVSTRAVWSLAFVLVFPTVLAYVLNLYALKHVPASTAAVFIYTQPIVTVLASAAILSEPPTRGVLVAAALVFLGIWLVVRPQPFSQRKAIHGDSPSP